MVKKYLFFGDDVGRGSHANLLVKSVACLQGGVRRLVHAHVDGHVQLGLVAFHARLLVAQLQDVPATVIELHMYIRRFVSMFIN